MKKIWYSMVLVVLGAQASQEAIMVRPAVAINSDIEGAVIDVNGRTVRYMPITVKEVDLGMAYQEDGADSDENWLESDVLDEDNYDIDDVDDMDEE